MRGERERGREREGGHDMYSFIHIATYVDYTEPTTVTLL